MRKINLGDRLGLPVTLEETGEGWKLRLEEPLRSQNPQVRRIEDIKAVLKNPKADTPKLLYWMYRDVRLPRDEDEIRSRRLRFDLTVFNPGVLCVGGQVREGDEWNKAAGHYHPYTVSGKTFPEIYEVVYGQGLFLLQEVDDIFAVPPGVKSFIIVEAREGDVIIIPPNCAHPTVVIGDEPLVIANWVARAFDSQYTPVRLMRGVAYYIVKRGNGWAWERNPLYPSAPEPKVTGAKENVSFPRPLYQAFLKDPEAFEFLIPP